MRRAALLLLFAACDGEDSLGQLGIDVDGKLHYDSTSCVLSTAASQHRPHGLYIYAELPLSTLEIDVDENGVPDPARVVYREIDAAGAETFRSISVTGGVVLLGPPKERRGDFQLEFHNATGQARKVVGSFAPIGKPLPPPDPNAGADDGSNNYGEAIDTGCEAASEADSEGCDGSGGEDTSASGCDGSGGEAASGCSGDAAGGSGCSGGGGGSCAGDAHASTKTLRRVHVRRFAPVRLVAWLFPYALVGVIVRMWRRKLTKR